TRNFMLNSVLKYLNKAEYLKFSIFKRLIRDTERFKLCAKTDFGDFIKFPECSSIINIQKKAYLRLLTVDDISNHFAQHGKVGRKLYFEVLHNNPLFREGFDFLDEFAE